MRLDPTLASSVVLADQSVVSFIASLAACSLHELGYIRRAQLRMRNTHSQSRNTQSQSTIIKEAELFRDTIDYHANIFIHRMVFVCVERDSRAVLVQLFFLLRASLAVEVRQVSFSAFRCPSTAGLGAGSLPSSLSPVHTCCHNIVL